MSRYSAYLDAILMAFALIHVVVGVLLFGNGLLEITRADLGSNLAWSFEMLNAYWFLVFAWPLFLLGYVVHTVQRQTGRVPAPNVLGWGLILVPVVSLPYLPVSGLWLFIPAGVSSLYAAKAQKGEVA